ncbi:sugar ABC transporter ATP-binding protein [Deinococcus apachensis]|uniref:sugar ABC transporter ATP-binding protein n=1 Tax=Deinococcus apachensis TaxID=309886 RepID=UPI000372C2DF|nr:sugar ABC transporter ATP-binding protein [Deinococcus apachensis]
MNPAQPLLLMEGITKTFPGVLALQDASLRVGPGEVHALIGQNGAGKSTLIKILTGAYRRDRGTIHLAGQEVDFHSPQAAQRGGISTIYQEVNLVGFRSVAENVFLGREPRRGLLIDWRTMNAEAKRLLERFDVRVDVTRPLSSYSVAVQQMVAIARAVSYQSRLVIMDEPTSSLDDREVETLFGVIRQLKAEGVSVVFVSHRLDELYAVCDRVTIMRDGRTVDERAMGEISKLELVAKMLGKEIGEVRREGETAFERTGPPGETVLDARDLRSGPALRGASVNVRAGEIVGLAGLLGSGRSETARAIFGADELTGGELRVNGKSAAFHSPADAISRGIGFCSEDRKTEGIIPHMTVRENLTLALLPALSHAGIVNPARQAEVVDRFIARLGIKTAGPDQKIRELSGGNQQKVLLARWLCLNPKLLLLDEPTRGIDVGAKAEIQSLLSELAREGMGVLMISSELEELAEGSNRVVVLRDGHSVAELPREGLTQDAIMTVMAHGSAPVEAEGGAHA